jgi:hypothetical protein
MKILISDQKMVRTIQKQFNNEFPHLKLEFFSKKHPMGEISDESDLIDHDKTLGEFRIEHEVGKIEITPEMTVNELEQSFQKVFGLSVQVFRLSENAWIQTTATDRWTLAKEEETAKLIESKRGHIDVL